MTLQSPNAGGLDQSEAASAVGPSAADPAFDLMAQRVLTRGHATTWLNHWSLLHADFRALARMNTVGFDGTLLQMRLRAAGHEVARTSADLVLPHVFSRLDDGTRITLIGAVPEAGEAAARRLERFDVQVIDGYDGLRRFKAQPSVLADFEPRLVIVGLGAGLQEVVASVALGLVPEASVCRADGSTSTPRLPTTTSPTGCTPPAWDGPGASRTSPSVSPSATRSKPWTSSRTGPS